MLSWYASRFTEGSRSRASIELVLNWSCRGRAASGGERDLDLLGSAKDASLADELLCGRAQTRTQRDIVLS